jgi:glycogen synthase
MRLLFLSNFYPPHELGGMEQLTFEVTARLQARGHQVSVLTSRAGVAPGESELDNIIRSLFLQADIHYYSVRAFFQQRRAQEAANLQELRRAIDLVQPDVFVVWNMWNLSRSLPYWAEQWLPDRVAYYIASTWPMDPDIHEEYWNLPASRGLSEVAKRSLRAMALAQMRRDGYPPRLAFAHTVCVSGYIRDKLVAADAIPQTAGILYNGVDPAHFLTHPRPKPSSRERPLRLLFFGSLIPIKGVHVAVEALGILRQRGLADRCELTILGRGHPDYVASLTTRVGELDLQNHIRFSDWIARADVPDMLRQYDVFLFTSTGPEAMARTVMEAMAAGLLVIGSEVGGQVEMLVNEENSLTFQAEDAEALAGHIERLLREPALLSRLADAGQQMVLERFSLQRMVDEMETWLASLLP